MLWESSVTTSLGRALMKTESEREERSAWGKPRNGNSKRELIVSVTPHHVEGGHTGDAKAKETKSARTGQPTARTVDALRPVEPTMVARTDGDGKDRLLSAAMTATPVMTATQAMTANRVAPITSARRRACVCADETRCVQ